MGKRNAKRRKHWVIVTSLAVSAFMLISCVATKIVYDSQFPRYERPDEAVSTSLRYSDIEKDHLIHFKSGNNTLQGYLYGEQSAHALMVVAHGLGGGADSYLVKSSILSIQAFWCSPMTAPAATTVKGQAQGALSSRSWTCMPPLPIWKATQASLLCPVCSSATAEADMP